MKHRLIPTLVLLYSALMAVPALSGTGWFVDVMPGAVTANFAADSFKAIGDGGQQEEISLVSSIPNIALGLQVDMPSGYLGVRGGGGLLLNSRIRSYLLYADVSLSFEIERSVLLGPHLGTVLFTDAQWWGDADIDLSDSSGMMLGMHLIMGDKISYLLSVDYFSAVLDVDRTGSGWTTSEDELDLSGFGVQFGFRASF